MADDRLLLEIESCYASEEQESEQSELVRRLERAIRREAKTLDRKLEKLERELAEAEVATGAERQGELLKSALSRVSRGDREVVVRDWDSGEDVTIEKIDGASCVDGMSRRVRHHDDGRALRIQ